MNPETIRDIVLSMIKDERESQELLWDDSNHDDGMFYKLFFEEFGELSKELLENNTGNAIIELNQAIAVLVAWQEQLYSEYMKEALE